MDANTQDQKALSPVAELAIRVGRDRQRKLLDIRKALEAGDERRALDLTRELCGMQKQGHAA